MRTIGTPIWVGKQVGEKSRRNSRKVSSVLSRFMNTLFTVYVRVVLLESKSFIASRDRRFARPYSNNPWDWKPPRSNQVASNWDGRISGHLLLRARLCKLRHQLTSRRGFCPIIEFIFRYLYKRKCHTSHKMGSDLGAPAFSTILNAISGVLYQCWLANRAQSNSISF
jgi:hypothetical protein